ncbi:hypothetical protein [Candidatus Methylomirabilis sp.]|uniref:hypothetical protein n=1 Tax=Candidatus Methylomirabilis sp. TaxID=2032687 RepID=UPI0030763E40
MTDQSTKSQNKAPTITSPKKSILWVVLLLVGGALVRVIWDLIVQKLSLDADLLKTVLLYILPGMILVFGYLLIALLNNQYALMQLGRTELSHIIWSQLTEIFNREGKDLLKDTIVQGVINDAVGASSGKPRYHEITLSFLKILHEVDEQLAPALEIIARDHVNKLTEELKTLQHDDLEYSINGKEQVDISQSLADSAKSLIVFFDPKIYTDIDQNWSAAFRHFVCNTLNDKKISKRQYILCEDTSDITNPDLNPLLKAFSKLMKDAGFEVYLVPKKSLDEGHNKNFTRRLEIYDSICVLKVQSQGRYDQTQPLSITLTTVDKDPQVDAALKLLSNHGKKVA